jgi:hypothetical protein
LSCILVVMYEHTHGYKARVMKVEPVCS